jgi:hypothetical protein
MPKLRYCFYFVIGLLLAVNNHLILSYICTDWELAKVETKNLLALYDSLMLNPLILEKIGSVDTSYLFSQYEIFRIIIRNGFSYDQAKILYQYHEYHNISVGSIDSLVEYQSFNYTKPLDNDLEFDKEPKTLPPSTQFEQTEKLLALIVITYWIICLVPRPRGR